jgi:ABC-type branched-subunit amino acid transport system permease subunit
VSPLTPVRGERRASIPWGAHWQAVNTANLLQFLFSGLMVRAIYGLVALGLNIVFNATGAVNFAQVKAAYLGG